METYARGIPTYKGENGQTIGLLCETKEQCITDDNGVRLSDKLQSMQEQIGTGPDFTGYATEEYVDNAVSDKATTAYVDAAVGSVTGGDADTLDGLHASDFIRNGKRVGSIGFEAETELWIEIDGIKYKIPYGWNATELNKIHASFLPLDGSVPMKKLNDNDGGRLLLEKPTSAEADGSLAIDYFSNAGVPYARFVENGGNYRGAFIDLSKCENGGRGWGSEIFHTGNSSPCVVLATDPGVGASVSYANGTLLFVKGA